MVTMFSSKVEQDPRLPSNKISHKQDTKKHNFIFFWEKFLEKYFLKVSHIYSPQMKQPRPNTELMVKTRMKKLSEFF